MSTKVRETLSQEALELELSLGAEAACECHHGDEGPCGKEATWRVVLLCSESGCCNAAESMIICGPCKLLWESESADTPITFEEL